VACLAGRTARQSPGYVEAADSDTLRLTAVYTTIFLLACCLPGFRHSANHPALELDFAYHKPTKLFLPAAIATGRSATAHCRDACGTSESKQKGQLDSRIKST
jgi:hypothetical protein